MGKLFRAAKSLTKCRNFDLKQKGKTVFDINARNFNDFPDQLWEEFRLLSFVESSTVYN